MLCHMLNELRLCGVQGVNALNREHKNLFLATKDALNKALDQQQQLTEEQQEWRLFSTLSTLSCGSQADPEAAVVTVPDPLKTGPELQPAARFPACN